MSVRKILVAGDGTLKVEAMPDGLLGVKGGFAQLGCRGVGDETVGLREWCDPRPRAGPRR